MLRTLKAAIDANQANTTGFITARLFAGSGGGATLILNQEVRVYVTMFYNFVPRDKWVFAVDGECLSPEQCT